jgi:AraC-like DNA-binding protein
MPDGLKHGTFVARQCTLPKVQAVEACSARSFARHTHDGYGIGRVVSGAQRSWSGRGSVEAGPGDVITVNPQEVHDGAPIGGERVWRMLYFAPEAIAAMVMDFGDGTTPDFEFNDPVIRGHVHAEAFEAAYAALTGPRANAALAEERLILLLAGLIPSMRRDRSADSLGVARAKARIDDDPAAAHALSDLACVAGISRFQAVRGFAKLTGLTPHAYVVQRRLDAAREMIGSGSALADAAAACGFADQSHFTRTVVRRYGLTPGMYAAAMR